MENLKFFFILILGWVENPDVSSYCFDLKWCLKARNIDFQNLLPHQIVNHFERNTSLTTKFGLCRNIRNLIWYENVDYETFFPRCYDLGDITDFEDFIEDYKISKVVYISIKFTGI